MTRGTGSQLADNTSLKDMLDDILTALVYQHQADATLEQASPVQNTWYTLLDTTLNCRLIDISLKVATTSETLEVRITIDGVTVSGSYAPNANAWTSVSFDRATENGLNIYTTGYVYSRAFLIEGRSVKVEVRKTTANGSGTIYAFCKYAKIP